MPQVAAATRYIGTTERPRGSNRTPFGVRYGMNGMPWCAIFQWCVFADIGVDLRHLISPGWASCELGLMGFRANHWTVPDSAAQAGDLVFFQFDRDRPADHIGLITSTAGGRLQTIEGNTSDRGSQTNGGAVCAKSRNWAQVKGVGRVPGLGSVSIPVATPGRPTPPTVPAPHPNTEALPVPPPPDPDEDPTMAKQFIISDSVTWYLTDGITRRRVKDGQQAKELVFLGMASNAVTSAGDVQIPTNAPFLVDIPERSA